MANGLTVVLYSARTFIWLQSKAIVVALAPAVVAAIIKVVTAK